MRWHGYYVETNQKIHEIRSWFGGLPGRIQDRIAGELEDLFDQAAMGRTDPAAEGQPIDAFRLAANYFELRLTLEPDTDKSKQQLFRHYHFEPAEPDDRSLIALHAHFKDTSGEPRDVSPRQTAEMRYAIVRCDNGRSRSWGLPGDSGEIVDRLLDL